MNIQKCELKTPGTMFIQVGMSDIIGRSLCVFVYVCACMCLLHAFICVGLHICTCAGACVWIYLKVRG